jgi:hypothetical protein
MEMDDEWRWRWMDGWRWPDGRWPDGQMADGRWRWADGRNVSSHLFGRTLYQLQIRFTVASFTRSSTGVEISKVRADDPAIASKPSRKWTMLPG